MGERENVGETCPVRNQSHRELNVYKAAFDAAVDLHILSREFPREEMYSLTDQMRRSSRSVAANLAEAWRKRRYEAAFVAKLTDAESEAVETQVWIEFDVRFGSVICRASKAKCCSVNSTPF